MLVNINDLLRMDLNDLDMEKAIQLIESCGRLASRILRPKVYVLAGEETPDPVFLNQTGLCEVLVTIPATDDSVLRNAAIIPFQWKKSVKTDTASLRLPKKLEQLALSVKQVITQHAERYFPQDKIEVSVHGV